MTVLPPEYERELLRQQANRFIEQNTGGAGFPRITVHDLLKYEDTAFLQPDSPPVFPQWMTREQLQQVAFNSNLPVVAYPPEEKKKPLKCPEHGNILIASSDSLVCTVVGCKTAARKKR